MSWRNRHRDIQKPPKGERPYKIVRKCKHCNEKFEVKHKLRLFCDKCKIKRDGKI